MVDATSKAIEITIFIKSDGILSKTISAAADGSPVSDGSASRMCPGIAKRITLPDAQALADLIDGMKPNEALSLGRLEPGVGGSASVTTVRRLSDAPKGTIARSRDFLEFTPGVPAFMLLDIDLKGMPQAIKDRIEAAGGVVALLSELLPGLMRGARVVRASTSAGLSNTATGQTFAGSGGLHIYVLVENGDDIPRALTALSDRLWLNGLGWLNVGSVGQVLIRSIVDDSVGFPERLVFEGAPVIEPPIVQDLAVRRPIVVLGAAVDTSRVLPMLSEAERSRLYQIREEDRRRIAREVSDVRAAADLRLAREIAERDGVPIEVASRQVRARHQSILMPATSLVMDDEELGTVTAATILANPESFIGETLADPLEGPNYGHCKAMIMHDRETGGLVINSFAHGGAYYRICYDRALLAEVLNAAAPEHVVDIFIAKEAQAHLEPDDEAALIGLVSELSGVKCRPIAQRLKKERERRNRERRASMEARRSSSARPVFPAPMNDAELTPTMELLEDLLAGVPGDQPPMRDLSGKLVTIRRKAPPGLHTLSSASADPGGKNGEEGAIPAPPEPLIHPLSVNETAMLIEEYVEFEKTEKSGVRTVRLGSPFLSTFRALQPSKLPVVAAVSTAPFISPISGSPVAGVGLDREARIFYDIEPALLQCLPDSGTVTDEDAVAAYKFLADEWLVDVAADAQPKAVVIAAALTIVQRITLEQRPAFFIVAGQRGGGKTTLASMITTAVLGRPPAAAAWASNEDERRKALLSHLRIGAAAIVWDNIPRGALIKCPHLERALTSPEYTDRVLGVSEQITVPSLTVMLFTGNNIAPTGDMASRSLVCSLDVSRPDPENRPFEHADPIAWAIANRMRLMCALYTLLVWNPYLRLSPADRVEPTTRFKTWWSSVGAPIEAVTRLIGEAPVDFTELFAANEVDDEEANGVAIICGAIEAHFGTRIFTVREFCGLLETASDVCGNATDQASNAVAMALREALQSIHDVTLPTGPLPHRRVGQILAKAINRLVRLGDRVVRLRSVHKGHAGRTYQLEVL